MDRSNLLSNFDAALRVNEKDKVNQTLERIIANRRAKISEEKRWRALEVHFRVLERRWWAVERKRVYTDLRAEQLSVLAELAAFASGFQMVMLYELEFPGLGEYRYSSGLMALFGLSCLAVTCVNICIVFLAVFLATDLLNDSARESPWSIAEHEMRSPPGCSLDRVPANAAALGLEPACDTAEELQELWRQKYERRVTRVLVAFNYTAPIFMFNVGLSTLLKFYMAPAAGWSGMSVAVVGIMAWWYWHYPQVQHLRWHDPTENPSTGGSAIGAAEQYPPLAHSRSPGRNSFPGTSPSGVGLGVGVHGHTISNPD
jgi:hypothetical protein